MANELARVIVDGRPIGNATGFWVEEKRGYVEIGIATGGAVSWRPRRGSFVDVALLRGEEDRKVGEGDAPDEFVQTRGIYRTRGFVARISASSDVRSGTQQLVTIVAVPAEWSRT